MVTNYKLLNTKQVADRLDISQAYVKKLIRQGSFPNAAKLGDLPNSPFAIPEKDVLAFLSSWKPRHRQNKKTE